MTANRRELTALAKLAGPAIATQVGTMLMGVVDTLMVARVSTDALAAATIANVWLALVLYCAMGLLYGLDPIVSQAHGARDGERAARALHSGVVLALLISIPIAALFFISERALLAAGQEPVLAALAYDYLIVQVPGIPAVMVYVALRQYLQGRTIVGPAMWTIFAANGVNVLANWVLIFGHWGFPAMGLRGAGIATNILRIALLLMLVAWVWIAKLHRGAWTPWTRDSFRFSGVRAVLVFGVPVWLQMLLEIGAFSGSSLLVGLLGTDALGAHAIALNLASLAFMVPLGVAIAASTRIGNLYGAGDLGGVRRAARIALLSGSAVMLFSASLFIGIPGALANLYAADTRVFELCMVLLPIAGAFQLFDGTQVVACGILRGLGQTRPAALANLVAYWLLALPFGAWLAFRGGLGVAGIWWGFLVGLAIVAIGLSIFVLRSNPDFRPGLHR